MWKHSGDLFDITTVVGMESGNNQESVILYTALEIIYLWIYPSNNIEVIPNSEKGNNKQ